MTLSQRAFDAVAVAMVFIAAGWGDVILRAIMEMA